MAPDVGSRRFDRLSIWVGTREVGAFSAHEGVAMEGARSIDSVADVESLLQSDKYSFSECLDGVAVAEAAGRFDLVERCAYRAFDAVDAGAKPAASLAEAARSYIMAKISGAHGLETFSREARRASDDLRSVAGDHPRPPVRDAVVMAIEEVDAALLLLADGTSASYVSLCSRLRRHFRRPDLGIIAATKALSLDAKNIQALTTRGAAWTDRGLLEKAEHDLTRAWSEGGPSPFVANAMVRVSLAHGDTTTAVKWAEEAVTIAPNDDVSWTVLAAAAFSAGDTDLFRRAQARLVELGKGHAKAGDERWILCLAARQLLRGGNHDLAQQAVDTIRGSSTYAPAKRITEEIERARKRRPQAGA